MSNTNNIKEATAEEVKIFKRLGENHNFEMYKFPLNEDTNTFTIYYFDKLSGLVYVRNEYVKYENGKSSSRILDSDEMSIMFNDHEGSCKKQYTCATSEEGQKFKKMLVLKTKTEKAQREEWRRAPALKPTLGYSQELKEDFSRFSSAHNFEMYTSRIGENQFRRDAYYFDEKTNCIFHFYSPMLGDIYTKSKYSTISLIKKGENGKYIESVVTSNVALYEEIMKKICQLEIQENIERDKVWQSGVPENEM